MGQSTQTHSLDTWVSSSQPSAVYAQSSTLQVRADQRLAYIYFSRPFPLGATIISATLKVRTYAISGSGSRWLRLWRTQTRPSYTHMTWNNAPAGITGIPGAAVTVTKTGPQPGAAEWSFNVTGHMQHVSDGAPWSGWRIATDSTDILRIYGVDGGRYVPELTVVWSDAPDTPTQLSPSAGRIVGEPSPVLRFDYTDVSGDTEMSALHVQVHTSGSGHSSVNGWSSPAWDSGITNSSNPQLNLEGTTFPGIPDGRTRWWSVRVRDGAGLWSGWSDPAEMRYVPKASFTLIAPTPGGTLEAPASWDDATPVIAWNLSGATQASYRVRVWLSTDPKNTLWDSGRVTASTTSVTVPAGALRWDDRHYRVQVSVWDTLDRQTTPGVTAAYTETSVVFLDWDQVLSGTNWVSARPLDPYPFVELEWARTPAPDRWTIVRNNEILTTVDFADTLQPDGTHRWVDRYAPPRKELRYTVRPRVNGATAWGNPASPVVSDPVGLWLVNETDEVCLVDTDDGTWAMGEASAIHEPIRGDRVVQLKSGMRGYEGSLSGLLIGDVWGLEGVTARQWRDALLRVKRDGGAWLTGSSLSFPVLLSDVVAAPTPHVEEQYRASLSFWQSGYFDWDAL